MPVLRPSGSDFTSFVKAAAQYVPAGPGGKVSKSGGVPVSLPGLGAVVRTSQVGALASPTTSAVVINGVTPPPAAGGGPPMFSPASMSGLQLWLDASYVPSVAVSGTTVITWTDRSANARVLGVGSGTTTYGAQAVTITNSYLYVDSPVNLTNVIVFTVFKTNTNAGNQHWIAGKPASGGVSYSSPDGFAITGNPNLPNLQLFGTAGSGLIMASCPTLDTQCLVTWQQTSNSVASGYYNGGVQSATTNPANSRTGTALGFSIGSQWDGTLYNNIVATASFNEVLVYNTALTTIERQTIEGYLAWKWGIQASLPAGHPFKTAAPTA